MTKRRSGSWALKRVLQMTLRGWYAAGPEETARASVGSSCPRRTREVRTTARLYVVTNLGIDPRLLRDGLSQGDRYSSRLGRRVEFGGGPNVEHRTVPRASLKRRVVPSAVVFVVAAVGVYATAWLALGLLRHIVMPIIAIVIAGYLAAQVYRRTGRTR